MRSLALGNGRAPVRRFEPDRDGWWDDYRFTTSDDPGAGVTDGRAPRSAFLAACHHEGPGDHDPEPGEPDCQQREQEPR